MKKFSNSQTSDVAMQETTNRSCVKRLSIRKDDKLLVQEHSNCCCGNITFRHHILHWAIRFVLSVKCGYIYFEVQNVKLLILFLFYWPHKNDTLILYMLVINSGTILPRIFWQRNNFSIEFKSVNYK